jgi:hypothetical protein
LIGFGGVIVTLVATICIWLIEQQPALHFWTISLLFVSLIYFLVSILRSLSALERAAFHRVTARDVAAVRGGDADSVNRELAALYLNATVKNFNTINRKVEFVVVAHRYFKRGVIALSAGGTLLVLGHVTPVVLELLRGTVKWSCSYISL